MTFKLTQIQSILSQHIPLYSRRAPVYQTIMLNSLEELWNNKGTISRLLDVGGGTGIIAQAISQLMPVKSVYSIDVVNRFLPSLTISTQKYDGVTIPFADGYFDAAVLNNVLHHVPIDKRVNLLSEIRRVVNGPLYVKDHISNNFFDHIRLIILDALGNMPFGGMIQASYLSTTDWEILASKTNWKITSQIREASYRRGFFSKIFPNKLEISIRLDPI